MTAILTDEAVMQARHLKEVSLVSERSQAPLIRANALAYAVFQRANLERAARFFVDFGLLVDRREKDKIYFRGLTTDHIILVIQKGPDRLIGFGITADADDQERLSAAMDRPLVEQDAAIGGKALHLQDPNGLQISICHGLRSLASVDCPMVAHPWNGNDNKDRLSATVRHEITPNIVHKLGHSVIGAHRIKETLAWYQDTLGMIASDLQFAQGDGLPVIAFMRFDNGTEPTDHHSLGLASIIELGHIHSAFEMDNLEEIGVSSEWLRAQGYRHSWGMGRHILGSQIFDYWRDPSGDMFEHYTDGDLFKSAEPTGYHLLTSKAQHQWGPPITKDFTGEAHIWATLKTIIQRLFKKDDLSLRRVGRILRSVNS